MNIILSFIISHIILFSWPKISELTHQLVDTYELVISTNYTYLTESGDYRNKKKFLITRLINIKQFLT